MAGFDISAPPISPKKQEEIRRQTDENVKPSFGSGDGYKYNPDYHKMADFLGLNTEEKMDYDLAGKIAHIRDYTGEKDELDALVKIRDIIRGIGTQKKGKELVVSLYKYIRLAQDRERIDKEISLITHGR